MRIMKLVIGLPALALLALALVTVRAARRLSGRGNLWAVSTVVVLIAFAAANPVTDGERGQTVTTIGSDAVAPASDGTLRERMLGGVEPASAPSATLADPGASIDLGHPAPGQNVIAAPTTAMTNRPGAMHTTTAPAAPAAFDWRTLPPCASEDSQECLWLAGERGNGCGQSFYVHLDKVYPVGAYIPCQSTTTAVHTTTAAPAPSSTWDFGQVEARTAAMMAQGFEASAAGLPACLDDYDNYPCAHQGDKVIVIDDGYGDRWIIRF